MTEPHTTHSFSFGTSQPCSTPKRVVGVSCDLCGYGMPLPEICTRQQAILGLLVCTQCLEDELCAQVTA